MHGACSIIPALLFALVGLSEPGRFQVGPACLVSNSPIPLQCDGQLIIYKTLVTFNSGCGGNCQHDVHSPPHHDKCWVNMTHDGMMTMMKDQCTYHDNKTDMWTGCRGDNPEQSTGQHTFQTINCQQRQLCGNYIKMEAECIEPPPTVTGGGTGTNGKNKMADDETNMSMDQIYYIIGMVGVLAFVILILLATCCVILYKKSKANKEATTRRDQLRAAGGVTGGNGFAQFSALGAFTTGPKTIVLSKGEYCKESSGQSITTPNYTGSHQPVTNTHGYSSSIPAHYDGSMYQGASQSNGHEAYSMYTSPEAMLTHVGRPPRVRPPTPPSQHAHRSALQRDETMSSDGEEYYQQIPETAYEEYTSRPIILQRQGSEATNHGLVLNDEEVQIDATRLTALGRASTGAMSGMSDRTSGLGSMKDGHELEYSVLTESVGREPNIYKGLNRPLPELPSPIEKAS